MVIAFSCALIGAFGLPLLPLGNELVVETTYPVKSTTTTGLVFLGGQVQGILILIALELVAQPQAEEYLSFST